MRRSTFFYECEDWAVYFNRASHLIDDDFSSAVDQLVKAFDSVPHSNYNILYDRSVELIAEYLIEKTSIGDMGLMLDSLLKLGEKTDEFTLDTYVLQCDISKVILNYTRDCDSSGFMTNIFTLMNHLARQLFSLNTSFGPYSEMCETMISLCDLIHDHVPKHMKKTVEIYRSMYNSFNERMESMFKDAEQCLEFGDEWRFSGKSRVYLVDIADMYSCVDDAIGKKEDSVDISMMLDKFEEDYMSILS